MTAVLTAKAQADCNLDTVNRSGELFTSGNSRAAPLGGQGYMFCQ